MTEVGRAFIDWRRAVCESKLKAGTRHVLLVLSLYAPTIGEAAFPSLSVLASACGLSDKVVRDHLRAAEALGWIAREPRYAPDGRQTSNVYLLTSPGSAPPSRKPGGSPSPKPGGTRRKGGSSSTEERMSEPSLFADELPPGRVDYTADFEEIWQVHGKGEKKRAFTEYRQALRACRVTRQAMMNALTAYVESFRGDFTGMHLWRWIKEERWNNGHGKGGGGGDPLADLDRWKRAAAEDDA